MFRKTPIQICMSLAFGLLSNSALSACIANGTTLDCSNVTIWNNNDYGVTTYDKVVINNTVNGSTSPLSGYGIYSAGSGVDLKEVEITTSGSQADGIATKNGSATVKIDKLKIKTTGSSADGINLGKESNGRTIIIGDNAEIDAYSMGVRANSSTTGTGENLIIMGENAIITSQERGSNTELLGREMGTGYAVYAGNTNSQATGSARVVLGNGSQITSNGNNAHAVYANKGGVIELGHTSITTNGSGAHGIYAEAGSKSGGTVGSQVYLKGNTAVTVVPVGSSTKYALYAKGVDSVIQSYDPDTGTATSGIFDINGDMRAEGGGKIDLNMSNGSAFEGNTSLAGTGSELNLNINGASSYWLMSQNSQLTTLNLTNGAAVILGNQSTPITSSPSNRLTLTMENLSGSGVFHMRTDIIGTGLGASNIGDLVSVTGTSSGNHKVLVSDYSNGGATVDGTEVLKIIETADNGATFTLITSTVDVGAYQYELTNGTDGNANAIANGAASPIYTDGHWYLMSRGLKSSSADNSGNILNIGYLLSNVENQTLLQRMGELRRLNHSEGDIWVRGYLGKLNSFKDSNLSGFDMSYNGLQIGADKYLGNDMYVGMMMGIGKGDVDYEVGSGSVESNHLGLYGTYKTQDGFYIDTIAKYVHMSHSFDTITSGGSAVEGQGSTNGYSVGVEAGKRFYKESTNNGWYLEPQAQLTFSHQSGTDIKSSNGLKTGLDSFNSLIGRVSIVGGYSIIEGKNPVDIYLKTGYVKEFKGETGYTFNDTTHEDYIFDGNWWDNGIGVSAQINNRHNFYLEADYALGDKFNKKQINLGYRYAF